MTHPDLAPGEEKKGWLPIVLCPTDGIERMLLLPDGREVSGCYDRGGLGQRAGWTVSSPVEVERPVYETPLRGGFMPMPWEQVVSRPEPERKQIGTRKEVMWVQSMLPDGIYPTHFRPNDTVYGTPAAALSNSTSRGG